MSPCLLNEKSINLVGRANLGETKAFDRVLDLAYGRKGKLRWELMKVCRHAKSYSKIYLLGTERSHCYRILVRLYLNKSFL